MKTQNCTVQILLAKIVDFTSNDSGILRKFSLFEKEESSIHFYFKNFLCSRGCFTSSRNGKKNVEVSGASRWRNIKWLSWSKNMKYVIKIKNTNPNTSKNLFTSRNLFIWTFYVFGYSIFLSIFIKCFTLWDMLWFFKQCFGILFCVSLFETDGSQNIFSLFYMNVRGVKRGCVKINFEIT